MAKDRIDALYAGWLGKVIGVRHGANIEGWSQEQIQRVFGEIQDYPFSFQNFCADDDLNGPVFLQRAILDYGPDPTLSDLGDTLLNYAADGHGFFWWGGYGISTEDTAYHNLLDGIDPPLSGSALLNGEGTANQIGGEIFSDCWGLACLGNPKKAADLARRMSSVTHDEEAVNGAGFIAAAIAAAYTAKDVEEILKSALSFVPKESAYALMVRDVWQCAKKEGLDFRRCFSFVKEHYDYSFFPGSCHVLPNAAVVVTALLCGCGDFAKTIRIAAMCGWDTDCNEGNLGAILGVFSGTQGIESSLKDPLGDLLILSGLPGSRNIQSISQAALTTLAVSEILGEWESNALFKKIFSYGEGVYFHFQFPGSTHALRIRQENKESGAFLRNEKDPDAFLGTRSLVAVVARFGNGDCFEIYWKPYYGPEEFDDNRYQPDFSPLLYPGDALSFHYRFDPEEIGKRIRVRTFLKDRVEKRRVILEEKDLAISSSSWQKGSILIPPAKNKLIEEVGVEILAQDVAKREATAPFLLHIGDVRILSKPSYSMDRDGFFEEKWTAIDVNPAGFSYLRGNPSAFGGKLEISGGKDGAEMYTGSCLWEDIEVQAVLLPVYGPEHFLLGRVQGGLRWYGLGLIQNKEGRFLALLKKDKTIRVLEKCPFFWTQREPCTLKLTLKKEKLSGAANDRVLLEAADTNRIYTSGCIGFGSASASRTRVLSYGVSAL